MYWDTIFIVFKYFFGNRGAEGLKMKNFQPALQQIKFTTTIALICGSLRK